MPQKDIAHNNVDILLKVLGNDYKNKSFAAYGLNLPKIVDFRPTDLPAITGKERFADHIFDLADGSHAIVDYESRYRKKNFVKYGNYATRVLEREMEARKAYKLRIIVIYAGDVGSAPSEYKTDCLVIKVENVFLSKLNGSEIYASIMKKITSDEALNEVEQMRLVILPLTQKGKRAKIAAADRVIHAAEQIKTQSVRSFVLAGLSVAGAGFLTDEQDAKILEMLKMTRIGKMIQREIEEKSAEASKKARNEGLAAGRAEGRAAGRAEGRAEGHKTGILASIRNLMASMNWSAQEAMSKLNIAPTEQKEFVALLNA